MTQELIANYRDRYSRPQTEAELAVDREVFGAAEGICSYATVDQVDALARHLQLRPGLRLLDIGAGRGWPGLYLARTTGCRAFISDVPAGGLLRAEERARVEGLLDRVCVLQASATALPFRSGVIDRVVHTDVL